MGASSCYRRIPLLRTIGARNVFAEALGAIRDRYKFSLVGYVLMPEYVPLLFSEPPESTPSIDLKVLKQRVARDLRKDKSKPPIDQLHMDFMTGDAELPGFWEPRFPDFKMYSGYKVREKLEYMHEKPVKRGLVKNAGEWVWSSFWFYEKGEQGLVT
jgi:putative transposase